MIKVTPDELRGMAGKLRAHAGEATNLASNIKATVDAALAAWEGNAQKEYADRFNEIYPVMSTQLPQLINEMAANADQRAQMYDDADRT